MISVKQETERETARYAEAPNFHLDGDSDDDQEDRISESESNCSEQWYELDGQEQEALISLRDARKKLQHATKSKRFYPKGGGRARSTGKCGQNTLTARFSLTFSSLCTHHIVAQGVARRVCIKHVHPHVRHV